MTNPLPLCKLKTNPEITHFAVVPSILFLILVQTSKMHCASAAVISEVGPCGTAYSFVISIPYRCLRCDAKSSPPF